MNLFRVEVTKVLYVVANDKDEAQLDAWRYAERDDQDPSICVGLATTAGIEADGWKGCLAYHDREGDYPVEEAVKLNNPK